jgi:uncharacterized protein (TIGR03435 family)
MRATSGSLTSGAMTMSGLAQSLSFALGRPVANEAGLTGYYELTLTYATERQIVAGPPVDARADNDRVSIFTALQEQLGLTLEPRRSSEEFLIIERIEPPSAN